MCGNDHNSLVFSNILWSKPLRSSFSWLLFFQNGKPCIDECKNTDVLRTTQHKLLSIHVAVMLLHLCSGFNFGRTFISRQIHNQENLRQASGRFQVILERTYWPPAWQRSAVTHTSVGNITNLWLWNCVRDPWKLPRNKGFNSTTKYSAFFKVWVNLLGFNMIPENFCVA